MSRSLTGNSLKLLRGSLRQGRAVSTVSADEIAHFSRFAQEWWDPNGEFKLLHRMNKSRVQFLRETLQSAQVQPLPAKFLSGQTALDVGCGGGLFSETLARLGANTLGIDAATANIQAARIHAAQDPSLDAPQLSYEAQPAEQLLASGSTASFDLVCSMDVLEHVDEPRLFLKTIAELVKPGGTVMLSTIARTPLAKLLTIDFAENPYFGIVAPGTHDFSKYVKPSELVSYFTNDLGWSKEHVQVRGVFYEPWSADWHLGPKSGAPGSKITQLGNYLFVATRPL